jgi:hypothetical protein
MSLSGNFSSMPLTDLLQWLGTSRKTGALKVRRGSVSKTLFLDEGRLVASLSDDPNEMLGQFLLARGSIDEDQLRQGLRAQQKSRVFLGKILVMCGMLKESELKVALTQKAEETVYSLFEWEDASFDFEEGEKPDRHMVTISLKVDDVVLRGVQRLDEMNRVREVFPDGRVVLRRSGKALPRKVLDHPLARRIMERLDEEHTIDEITLDVHASPFRVQRFLFDCHRVGLVEITRQRAAEKEEGAALPAGAETLAVLVNRCRRLLADGESEACIALLEEVLLADEDHEEARALLAEAEKAFAGHILGAVLPADSVPSLTRPLEALTSERLRPEEFFLLSRIDGAWDIKSIIDIAPMREAEALRVLKRLRERGVITLREGSAAAGA